MPRPRRAGRRLPGPDCAPVTRLEPVTLWVLLALAPLMAPPRAVTAHPGDHAQLAALDTLLATHEGDVALLLERAELLRLAGETVAADSTLVRAARRAPGDHRIPLLRARLSLDLGDAAAALDDADSAVRMHPDDPAARVLRAEIHARLGHHGAVAADLDQAIERMSAPRPEHFLARARAVEATGDPSRALAGLGEARERLGPVVVLEREAMRIEAALGRFDAALARLDRLMPQFERRGVPLVERGDLLARAGRRPAAIAAWTEALEALESADSGRASDANLIAAIRTRLHDAAATAAGP